jgi:hypothetical protein
MVMEPQFSIQTKKTHMETTTATAPRHTTPSTLPTLPVALAGTTLKNVERKKLTNVTVIILHRFRLILKTVLKCAWVYFRAATLHKLLCVIDNACKL